MEICNSNQPRVNWNVLRYIVFLQWCQLRVLTVVAVNFSAVEVRQIKKNQAFIKIMWNFPAKTHESTWCIDAKILLPPSSGFKLVTKVWHARVTENPKFFKSIMQDMEIREPPLEKRAPVGVCLFTCPAVAVHGCAPVTPQAIIFLLGSNLDQVLLSRNGISDQEEALTLNVVYLRAHTQSQ